MHAMVVDTILYSYCYLQPIGTCGQLLFAAIPDDEMLHILEFLSCRFQGIYISVLFLVLATVIMVFRNFLFY